jgi:hypothetical protein
MVSVFGFGKLVDLIVPRTLPNVMIVGLQD